MHHLTETGYYAGCPWCGIDRAANPDDTYSHVPYSHLEGQFFARTDLCPECRRLWDEAGQSEDDLEQNP